eukprot:7334066-Ditylum_brightwellii.AAC.1
MEEHGVEPNARTLSSIIEALSKSGGKSSEAEPLLRKMIQMNQNGDTSATPDVRTFTKLINIICGEADAIDRSMGLLDYMRELSDLGDNINSKEKRSAQLAEKLLQQMEEQAAAGDDAAKPDHITYSSLISTWTNS